MNEISSNIVNQKTKWAYGLGGFGKDFGLNVVNIYLFFYYTDVAGISAVFVGTLFLFARVWDTINDPIIGYMVAKTNSRWGRYKPWILSGNILNAIVLILMFSAHWFEGNTQLIFVAITYVAWGMTYTMLDAPFWSLLPVITLDKSERERLMPYPRLFATAASYLAGGIGIYIIKYAGDGNEGLGYFYFGIIAATLALLSGVITCMGVKQNITEEHDTVKKFNYKDAINAVIKNDQFIALVTLSLFFNISLNFVNGLNLYFFKYVLNDETLLSTSMLWAGISGVIVLIFFKSIVDFLGRKILFSMSLIFPIVAAGLLYLCANTVSPSTLLIGFSGMFTGLSGAIYWLILLVMVADTVDYGDLKDNIRSESILYSMNTLVSKSSGALTGFLVGIALTNIGYIANVQQSVETISGLQFIYFAPTLLCIISLIIYKFLYKLNGDKLIEIQKELEIKHNI